MDKPIRLLLVEDNPGDVRLFKEYLKTEEFVNFEWEHVERLKTGLEYLVQKRPDVILLDLGLPDSQGFDTFVQVNTKVPEVPIIVLTGLNDSDQAVKAVTNGAQDYLIKGEVNEYSLHRAIRYGIERKRIEDQLRESNNFNANLLKTIPFGIDIVNENGQLLYLNPALEKLLGDGALGKFCWELYKDDKQQCLDCPLKMEIQIGETHSIESRGVFGGKIFEISHTGMIYQNHKAILEVFQDITKRKNTELKLADQLDELKRWRVVMLGREERIQELKQEINESLQEKGLPAKYLSSKPGNSNG
jgi:two-component system sensor histidine kinase UhpB